MRCVAHTGNDFQAWWEVDLAAPCKIDEVIVYTRTHCMDRLWPCWLLISTEQMPVDLAEARALACKEIRLTEHQRIMLVTMDDVIGRHVRIQLEGTNNLQLAQVEVYGKARLGG